MAHWWEDPDTFVNPERLVRVAWTTELLEPYGEPTSEREFVLRQTPVLDRLGERLAHWTARVDEEDELLDGLRMSAEERGWEPPRRYSIADPRHAHILRVAAWSSVLAVKEQLGWDMWRSHGERPPPGADANVARIGGGEVGESKRRRDWAIEVLNPMVRVVWMYFIVELSHQFDAPVDVIDVDSAYVAADWLFENMPPDAKPKDSIWSAHVLLSDAVVDLAAGTTTRGPDEFVVEEWDPRSDEWRGYLLVSSYAPFLTRADAVRAVFGVADDDEELVGYDPSLRIVPVPWLEGER
jgi:hypothetical protein